MWDLKGPPRAKIILKKNKNNTERLPLADFKLYYDTIIKQCGVLANRLTFRPMEQNRV